MLLWDFCPVWLTFFELEEILSAMLNIFRPGTPLQTCQPGPDKTRATAQSLQGKDECLAQRGTQAARVAARETAEGSPQGETSGSERVNIPKRSAEAGFS
jgi:hypothetical protein